MTYSQSKKLTDTEKRLQVLKTQLFGKESNQIKVQTAPANIQTNSPSASYQPQDLSYLRKDLKKIALLAFVAIGAQLILYMQFTFKVLRIN